jgi:sugar O-acyltransferase (sialic acid O-acetyltransferase NeuD family)
MAWHMTSMAEPIALYVIGAGGHGAVVADVARLAGYQVHGFLDDAPGLQGVLLDGVPVRGPVATWRTALPATFIVAIGDNRIRGRIFDELAAAGAAFSTLTHPRAWLAPGVHLGPGSVAVAGAIVNPGAVIGRNVILNTASSVDHHGIIGDHVHLAPGVRLGGNVMVGAGALVGIGAVVLPGLRIGEWAVVGAGAVVIANVPDGATVAGIPARILR